LAPVDVDVLPLDVSIGSVAMLSALAIAQFLTASVFTTHSAAVFGVNEITGTFVETND
jgi:hypothetical protein